MTSSDLLVDPDDPHVGLDPAQKGSRRTGRVRDLVVDVVRLKTKDILTPQKFLASNTVSIAIDGRSEIS